MKLIAEFPDYLDAQEMLTKDNTPCFIKAGYQTEIILDYGRRNLHGKLSGWSEINVCSLCPAGAGGEYIYYNHAMITINKINQNEYDVINLKMFDAYIGWCNIIIDGEYATTPKYQE